MNIENLEPKIFYRFFKELSDIPRCSGDEKAVSDYVFEWAKAKGLEAVQDEKLNVVISKAGSKGYENAPVVIIQAHLDMVCEKNKGVEHDFSKDALKLVVEGDFIRASGTTLGADNGAGAAMGMALLDSDSIEHPSLKVILTTGEEVGMFGAAALSSEHLNGDVLINLDSAHEGVLTVSCAGGVRVFATLKPEYIDTPKNHECISIAVSGLKGGHSGIDIDKGRGNSNRILGMVLSELNKKFCFYLASVDGGEKENAIPREAEARILVSNEDVEGVKAFISEKEVELKREYRVSDSRLKLALEVNNTCDKVFTREFMENVLAYMTLIPCGVQYMNMELPGFVETSINLGVAKTDEDGVKFAVSIRSSVASRKYSVLDQVKNIARLTGAEIAITGDYPAWEYNPNSSIREVCVDTYKEMYGKEPLIHAIHAGLECGILYEKAKNLDIISFGPDIFDYHSPDERASISSMNRTWEYLLKVVGKVK